MSDRYPRPGLFPGANIFPNLPDRPRSGARPDATVSIPNLTDSTSRATTPDIYTPTQVGTDSDWKAVSGNVHVQAIKG
jgi:hypothetical protein